MNNRQRKTLEAIFASPVPKNLAWADIESLLNSLGAAKVNRDGSAVSFISMARASTCIVRIHKKRQSLMWCAMRRNF